MEKTDLAFLEGLYEDLEAAKASHLFRECRIVDPSRTDLLVFADNDYLGLSRHPKVISAFEKAIKEFGAGSGASRLISGTSRLHDLLEQRIARFKRKEKAVYFSSGYLTNLGIVSAIAGKKDLVVVDKLNHASIIDACRLSGAALRVYPHKKMEKLETILSKSAAFRRRVVVTDSVFSMDGDLAPLEDLVRLKKKYDAVLMVDEAHGTGVFGRHGRGAAEHFEVEDEIDISMGTLSKAAGVMGGFAAGSRIFIDYLVNFSRPFIFSTAPPAGVAAACIQSLEIMEEDPAPRKRLWENIAVMRAKISALGFSIGDAESPIIPIHIGREDKALEIASFLRANRIFVPAIRYPTVGRGQARLRVTASARYRPEELDVLFAALRKAKELL